MTLVSLLNQRVAFLLNKIINFNF